MEPLPLDPPRSRIAEMPPKRQWLKRRLRAVRKTQGDLARALHVSDASISRLLAGKREITETELREIARLLDVTTAELVTRLELDAGGTGAVITLAGTIGPDGTIEATGPADVVDLARHAGSPGFDRWQIFRCATAVGRYEPGELLVFLPPDSGHVGEAVGHECIVTVSGGARLLRRVEAGTRPGLYHLLSPARRLEADVAIADALILEKLLPPRAH